MLWECCKKFVKNDSSVYLCVTLSGLCKQHTYKLFYKVLEPNFKGVQLHYD